MRSIFSILLFTSLAMGFASVAAGEEIQHLKEGSRIPDVALQTEEGKQISLREEVASQPAVLIFYRGGWCPYCTGHLGDLAAIEEDLRKAGMQLLAISPDQPAKLRETPDREKLGYRLLSDSSMEAAKAFGIAFQVEADLVRKYKEEYKIDLEAASGKEHHLLPHPAVFVVDRDGIVHFVHVNPDYKSRLDPAKILEGAKAAVK